MFRSNSADNLSSLRRTETEPIGTKIRLISPKIPLENIVVAESSINFSAKHSKARPVRTLALILLVISLIVVTGGLLKMLPAAKGFFDLIPMLKDVHASIIAGAGLVGVVASGGAWATEKAIHSRNKSETTESWAADVSADEVLENLGKK